MPDLSAVMQCWCIIPCWRKMCCSCRHVCLQQDCHSCASACCCTVRYIKVFVCTCPEFLLACLPACLSGLLACLPACRGRLYLQLGIPSSGPAIQPGSIITQPTGDVRGNGAYATQVIPAGTYITDYAGEVLDNHAFFSRYPDGVVSGGESEAWLTDSALGRRLFVGLLCVCRVCVHVCEGVCLSLRCPKADSKLFYAAAVVCWMMRQQSFDLLPAPDSSPLLSWAAHLSLHHSADTG